MALGLEWEPKVVEKFWPIVEVRAVAGFLPNNRKMGRLAQKFSRLRSSKDFKRVYQGGQRVANRDQVVFFLKSEITGETRIGFSLSKKIGTATVRNRLKRLLREAYRRNETNVKKGYDLIVIARPPLKGKSLQEIEKALLTAFAKAGLLRGET